MGKFQLQLGKDYSVGTLRYNWPMSVNASQAYHYSVIMSRWAFKSQFE